VRFELLWLAYKGVDLNAVSKYLCFHPVTIKTTLAYLVHDGYLDERFNITDRGKERIEKCLELLDKGLFSWKPLVRVDNCLVPIPRVMLCNEARTKEEFLRCVKGNYSKVKRFPEYYTNWDRWVNAGALERLLQEHIGY